MLRAPSLVKSSGIRSTCRRILLLDHQRHCYNYTSQQQQCRWNSAPTGSGNTTGGGGGPARKTAWRQPPPNPATSRHPSASNTSSHPQPRTPLPRRVRPIPTRVPNNNPQQKHTQQTANGRQQQRRQQQARPMNGSGGPEEGIYLYAARFSADEY